MYLRFLALWWQCSSVTTGTLSVQETEIVGLPGCLRRLKLSTSQGWHIYNLWRQCVSSIIWQLNHKVALASAVIGPFEDNGVCHWRNEGKECVTLVFCFVPVHFEYWTGFATRNKERLPGKWRNILDLFLIHLLRILISKTVICVFFCPLAGMSFVPLNLISPSKPITCLPQKAILYKNNHLGWNEPGDRITNCCPRSVC